MIKLTELLSEKYLYPKGTPLQKGFQQMTKDIDKMMKYSKTWDKFYSDFKRKYSEYPKDDEAVKELEDLFNAYHSPNEVKSIKEVSFVKGKTYGGTKCEGGCYMGKNGLTKIQKISKDNPDDVFIFRDDNYSGIQPHFIKNGVIAKANTLNPSYDLEKSKVKNLKVGKDVIFSIRLFEPIQKK